MWRIQLAYDDTVIFGGHFLKLFHINDFLCLIKIYKYRISLDYNIYHEIASLKCIGNEKQSPKISIWPLF